MNIEKIWRGDSGLAVTYWIYGVVGSALFGIPFRFVKPGSPVAIITVILFSAYFIWVSVGIWRAANKYQGPKIWTLFTKVFVALPVAAAVIGVPAAILIPLFSGAAPPNESISSGQTPNTVPTAPALAIESKSMTSSTSTATLQTEITVSESSQVGKTVACIPRVTMAQAKTLYPSLRGLDDDSVVEVLHETLYKDLPIEQIAEGFCIKLTPPKKKQQLSSGDLLRYEGCQKDAALAPTVRGVNILMQLCREKFNQ